eukprot:gene12940-biopygen6083
MLRWRMRAMTCGDRRWAAAAAGARAGAAAPRLPAASDQSYPKGNPPTCGTPGRPGAGWTSTARHAWDGDRSGIRRHDRHGMRVFAFPLLRAAEAPSRGRTRRRRRGTLPSVRHGGMDVCRYIEACEEARCLYRPLAEITAGISEFGASVGKSMIVMGGCKHTPLRNN